MTQAKVVQLPVRDEGVLVGSARAGDRRAFEVLFSRELPHVVRLLSRLVGHDAEVPDLANEVMVLGWQRLRTSGELTRFGAFLSGVCVNVARNHLRSKRRRRWLSFGDDDADAPAPERTTPREALAATTRVLDGLDPELRLAFVLRFVDGRELAEVATLMGVSLATVKRRLTDAERAFVERAKRHPALAAYVESSERWGGTS